MHTPRCYASPHGPTLQWTPRPDLGPSTRSAYGLRLQNHPPEPEDTGLAHRLILQTQTHTRPAPTDPASRPAPIDLASRPPPADLESSMPPADPGSRPATMNPGSRPFAVDE